MKNLGYYNGKYGLVEEMQIPMSDRVCWFGDGVYDAGPSRNYKIFAMDEHIDRFFRSAEGLDIEIPVSKKELEDLLNQLIQEMDTGENFVYYQVTRGSAERNHIYKKGPGNLWIMMKPMGINEGTVPIKLITEEDTRFFHCNLKTLNLIPAVMASKKAEDAGCDEAVFYRPGGRITECAHSNVSILKAGKLITAPLDHLILPGIARAHILKACKKLGIPVEEREYFLPDLFDADEIIVSSSSNLCLRADEIDGKPAGGRDRDTYERIRQEVIEEFYLATEY